MAHKANDGSLHTNRNMMVQRNRSLESKSKMGENSADPLLSPVSEPDGDEMGMDNTDINDHLANMHEQDGKAHSHVIHHGDGTHTSHHVDENGEVSGPHDHENLQALKDHFDQFLNEESHEGEDGGY